jgi:hypothetical protein
MADALHLTNALPGPAGVTSTSSTGAVRWTIESEAVPARIVRGKQLAEFVLQAGDPRAQCLERHVALLEDLHLIGAGPLPVRREQAEQATRIQLRFGGSQRCRALYLAR